MGLPNCYRCGKEITPRGECGCRDGICLVCGDCRDVLPLLEAGCVDLVLTDPPYGITQAGVTNGKLPGKGTRSFDFHESVNTSEASDLVESVLQMTLPLMSDSGSAYWWCGHSTFGSLIANYEGAGWKTRFLVWVKACPPPQPPGTGWPSGAELCVYAFRNGRTWTHTGYDCPRSNVIVSDSYRHGIPGKVGHPTQKPFGVIYPLLRASSVDGAFVLDPFAGSGTTGVACKEFGRRCLMIEKEEKYCSIAANRLRQDVLFN